MRFTKSLSFAAISASVLTLLAPVRLPASKHPKYGGTLRLELQLPKVPLDPREWKPGSVTAAENARLAALVFDRLLTLDGYGRFQPALATEWSHDAACKIWQFKLRPGVEFSDGSSLAPKDVVASLQSLFPPDLEISASEKNVQIRSAHPVPDLLGQLASGRYFIFRAQANGTFFGTGPFILAENSPSSPAEGNPSVLQTGLLRFRANDDAWSGRPFLDSIEVTLGHPGLRQILNLRVGRADVIDIPPDLVRKARQNSLRVWSSQPATLLALRFDDSSPAASDARLREALDLALDRDTMANVLLQREALPVAALLPQWLSGYAFLFGTRVNLDRAKQIRFTLPAKLTAGADPLRLRVDATSDLMKLLVERIAHNAHPDSVAGALADTPDTEKLYAEERRLLEERQVLPLLLLPDYVGLAPSVRNWSAAPSGEWRLADVWLDSESSTSNRSEATQGRNPAPGVHL
jgi:peptide/nickel transport system substrate-binding protein